MQGEYDVEANRRIYFSSLMGALGVPTYGSSGYDWASSPSIWFDSAASGSIGSLNDFAGDEEGESATPELIARYNGVAKTLRPTDVFEVIALGEVAQAATRGAHARSWARMEGRELVLMAYRPDAAGEPDALASRSTDVRVRDAVRASAPVIVSSQTPEGIAHSRRLAVVAYGDGPVVVRRESGEKAEVVSHYLGGTETKTTSVIRDGSGSMCRSFDLQSRCWKVGEVPIRIAPQIFGQSNIGAEGATERLDLEVLRLGELIKNPKNRRLS